MKLILVITVTAVLTGCSTMTLQSLDNCQMQYRANLIGYNGYIACRNAALFAPNKDDLQVSTSKGRN